MDEPRDSGYNDLYYNMSMFEDPWKDLIAPRVGGDEPAGVNQGTDGGDEPAGVNRESEDVGNEDEEEVGGEGRGFTSDSSTSVVEQPADVSIGTSQSPSTDALSAHQPPHSSAGDDTTVHDSNPLVPSTDNTSS